MDQEVDRISVIGRACERTAGRMPSADYNRYSVGNGQGRPERNFHTGGGTYGSQIFFPISHCKSCISIILKFDNPKLIDNDKTSVWHRIRCSHTLAQSRGFDSLPLKSVGGSIIGNARAQGNFGLQGPHVPVTRGWNIYFECLRLSYASRFLI